MNAQKQLNTFVTPRRFISIATVKEWTRCLVPGKNGCTTGCGCTPKGKIDYFTSLLPSAVISKENTT